MADIKLTDLVLLASEFRMWPRGASVGDEQSHEEDFRFDYPPGDLAEISASVGREPGEISGQPGEYVLYVGLKIDDDAFEFFMLNLTVGARFEIGEEGLTAERLEPTLVWLCYPYLRELVASITGRSPLPPYYMPALTKMPDPAVLKRSGQGSPE